MTTPWTRDKLKRIDQEIGHRIRARRNEIGVTQEDLAFSCGVTFQQIQKYEKGSNRVSGSRLVQISNALHVPPSFFVTGLDK